MPTVAMETSTAIYFPKASIDKTGFYNLRSKLSVLEFKTNAELPKAFFEVGEKENTFICIPKIPKNTIYNTTKTLFSYKNVELPYVAPCSFNLTAQPLPHQKEVAKKMVDEFKFGNDKRVILALAPGLRIPSPYESNLLGAFVIRHHTKLKFF